MRGNIFSRSAVRRWSERLEGALDVHTIMGFQRPMDRYVEVPGQTRANGAGPGCPGGRHGQDGPKGLSPCSCVTRIGQRSLTHECVNQCHPPHTTPQSVLRHRGSVTGDWSSPGLRTLHWPHRTPGLPPPGLSPRLSLAPPMSPPCSCLWAAAPLLGQMVNAAAPGCLRCLGLDPRPVGSSAL